MGREVLALLAPLKKDRLGDRVASDLRSLILSGKIEPGQLLPSERDLADQFSVSRVAVREGLRILEHSGLVEISPSPRGGARVANKLYKPMAGSIGDLYDGGQLSLTHFVEVRRVNECLAARSAAGRATSGDLETLAALNEEILGALGDRVRLRHTNMAFHVAVAQIAGNPLTALIVRSLLEILNHLRPRSLQTEAFVLETHRCHREIIAALAQGDAERCAQEMARDVERTGRLAGEE
jgi:DNA-binding FadR family transcriptional regulator